MSAERRRVAVEAAENADMVVSALAHGGVDEVFFTSGSDLVGLQESVAKASARGWPTPRIVTALHEAVALNAAVGNAMVRRAPAATAVHVDVGTQNYGCALHNAHESGAPVLMLAGAPPRAFPGSMRGARDHPIHWVQDRQDQRELVGHYVKWMFRLESQDDPGTVVSRALQVACSTPQGPAFLTLPREVLMAEPRRSSYLPADALGLASPAAADPAAIDVVAQWLIEARRPLVVVGRSGKDPDAVAALVRVAELVGAPVTDNGFFGDRLSFPANHPLWETGPAACDADLVLVVDNHVPWVPAPESDADEQEPVGDDPSSLRVGDPRRAPGEDTRVAWIAEDPIASDIPLLEMVGDLRMTADPLLALEALYAALEDRMATAERERGLERLAHAREAKARQWEGDEAAAHAVRGRRPIDPRWAAHAVGQIAHRDAIFLDETLSSARLMRRYYRGDRPGSWLNTGGSGGGFCSGGAIGAKLAEPERDVIFASGDGYYMFGVPAAALWTATQYGAPYLGVVFVNARWTTGVDEVNDFYAGGYAQAAGYPGGRFDPPPDLAAEARAAGAHGESVTEPGDLEDALQRGLQATRDGQPAIVAVRVA